MINNLDGKYKELSNNEVGELKDTTPQDAAYKRFEDLILEIRKEIDEIKEIKSGWEKEKSALIRQMDSLKNSLKSEQDLVVKKEKHHEKLIESAETLAREIADLKNHPFFSERWHQNEALVKHVSHIFKYMQYFKTEFDSIRIALKEIRERNTGEK